MDCHDSVGSRFAIEDGVLAKISEWTDVEFQETAIRLREFVRNRMMPEAAGEKITKQNVLIQFGVSDESAIFPCPPAIKQVSHFVSREASRKVAEAMALGSKKICIHGRAGVGKTTAFQEVASLLPDGSEMIVFDCYGGGSYLGRQQVATPASRCFPSVVKRTGGETKTTDPVGAQRCNGLRSGFSTKIGTCFERSRECLSGWLVGCCRRRGRQFYSGS